MSFFQELAKIAKNRQAEKYMNLLLLGRIRLRDVPERLRMDSLRTWKIHTAAFRVDRGSSMAHFEEDLDLLALEIVMEDVRKGVWLHENLTHIEEHQLSCKAAMPLQYTTPQKT